MSRKKSEAVPEGNGPAPQQVGSGQPTLEDEYWRKIEELLKTWWRAEDTKLKSQRLASLEHDARQPRLTMEPDEPTDTRTRERTEGAATAVQAMHGDSFSTSRVDLGPKTTSTSFRIKADPPALTCRDDVVVDNGAAEPKSCLSPLEMRTTSSTGGSLPIGKTSTATETTFNQPPLRLYTTEETSLWTSVPSAWHDSCFPRNTLLAAPSCRRVIETKSGQNRKFDPGGSQSRLRAYPFLETWRALLCGEVMRVGAAGDGLQRFLEDR